MIGTCIIYLDKVDSSNNYAARELLTKSLIEGTLFVAKSQTSGRGQVGNSWESESGQNLTLSIVLYPSKVKILEQFQISKAISLGLIDFLSMYISHLSIKWPNDIYSGDRKIAGILIENSILKNTISKSIIGIGLNVNQKQFLSDAPNPVSMRQLTNKTYDLKQLINELCEKLDKRYNQLISGDSNSINNDYESMLYRKNKWSIFRSVTSSFEGKIVGVDPIGCLLIENKKGSLLTFQFKEVSFQDEPAF